MQGVKVKSHFYERKAKTPEKKDFSQRSRLIKLHTKTFPSSSSCHRLKLRLHPSSWRKSRRSTTGVCSYRSLPRAQWGELSWWKRSPPPIPSHPGLNCPAYRDKRRSGNLIRSCIKVPIQPSEAADSQSGSSRGIQGCIQQKGCEGGCASAQGKPVRYIW